jgi:ParB family chromosome partitioning protein
MMPLPKIADRFKGAVEKTAQERKIAELQTEIDRLRAADSPDLEAQVQALREQLQTSGEHQIAVDLVDPNPQQPRQTITEAAIRAKARSLEKYGQIAPIILIPQTERPGRYLLLDGQLRWSGAKLLGWQTIRAVIVPMPADVTRSSLLTFLHFEDLNPLDKAEAVVQQAIEATEMTAEEIATVLGTVLKRIERDGDRQLLADLVTATAAEQQQGLEKLGVKEKERALLLVLLDLGLHPGSFKANLLPMLSLPADLKTAIRQQGLKGAHALALSTLSAKSLNADEAQATKERQKITQQVLERGLTVPETRKLIAEVKQRFVPDLKSTSFSDRIETTMRQLKKQAVWKDQTKRDRLEELLKELEALVS